MNWKLSKLDGVMIFRKVNAPDSENHTTCINTMPAQNAGLYNDKVGGTYGNHRALKLE
jgi:hypothetical protein